MLEGEGKLFIQQTKGPKGGSIIAYIHISTKLIRDSQFPFRKGDKLEIRVDPKNKALSITKKVDKRS